MKTKLLIFSLLIGLTSCNSVFVWTIKDAIGLAVLGIVVLAIIFYLILRLIKWIFK